ncbi:MAG: hypothetical protein KKH83_04245 [Candidatus Margulisbacteria bacterium]|nr:hypothetical protein [Candidatus Margulisiibacteriota bacterium]
MKVNDVCLFVSGAGKQFKKYDDRGDKNGLVCGGEIKNRDSFDRHVSQQKPEEVVQAVTIEGRSHPLYIKKSEHDVMAAFARSNVMTIDEALAMVKVLSGDVTGIELTKICDLSRLSTLAALKKIDIALLELDEEQTSIMIGGLVSLKKSYQPKGFVIFGNKDIAGAVEKQVAESSLDIRDRLNIERKDVDIKPPSGEGIPDHLKR